MIPKESEFKLKRRPLIVWNNNPVGSRPIMIVTDWHPDFKGGQAHIDNHYSIAPGEGIDLHILGLDTIKKEPK